MNVGTTFSRAALLCATFAASACVSAPAWTETTGGNLPDAIGAFESDMGVHYTTADGFTLYVYDADTTPFEATCVESCGKTWPPFVAPDDAQPVGDWAPFKQEDGTAQWAYKGRPVYRYYMDLAPHATVGDGVQNVWHVVIDLKPRPPGIAYNGTILGRVITGPDHMTLYSRADNTCTDECLRHWTPYAAAWSAKADGDWTVVTRPDDGTLQWAWKGRWLFAHRDDPNPGDVRGHGADGVWEAALIQPTPELPPWVTVTPSDYGPIFADRDGRTLYSVSEEGLERIEVEATCKKACVDEFWIVQVAEEGAKPVGNWSLVPLPDGRKQWAYRGRRIYTHVRDANPGEIYGDKFAAGMGFNSGWQVIPQLTLREEML